MKNWQKVNDKNEALRKAFRELRKQGFIARMNFKCCQSCAGYDLSWQVHDLLTSGKKTKDDIKGLVYFHNQANERREKTGKFAINYGSTDLIDFGTVGLDTVEIGQVVVDVLSEVNIKTEWDGEPSSSIIVDLEYEN